MIPYLALTFTEEKNYMRKTRCAADALRSYSSHCAFNYRKINEGGHDHKRGKMD